MNKKVDPKFFEKLSDIYLATKYFHKMQEDAVIAFAKFIDMTLNEEENKGGAKKRL